MLLVRLLMYNFRQFHGKCEILFSTDSEKNVTLVHGENGVGKTTILNAIHWALFEKLTGDFEGKDKLICEAALKEGAASCRVELEFEHEGRHYHVNRRLDRSGATEFAVNEIENGNYIPIPLKKAFVNQVLPEDMAEYFFFHGEGLSELAKGKSGSKFRRAIRDILGFTFAEHAIKDLKYVNSRLTGQIQELTSGQAALTQAAKRKSELEEIVIALEDDIEELKNESAAYAEQYEGLIRQIENSGHEDASRLQRAMTSLEADIGSIKSTIGGLEADRQSLIQKYGWTVFGHKLASKTLDFIDESTLKGRIPAPYDETLVRDLMETGRCICGRELVVGTDPHKCVMGLLETANTALIQQRLQKARSVADKMKGQAVEFRREVEKLEKRLADEHKRLGQKEGEWKQADAALGEIKQEDINTLKAKANLAKSNSANATRRLGAKEDQYEQFNLKIKELEKEIVKGTGKDEKVAKVQRSQLLVAKMIERCEERLDEYEASARLLIAQKVNKILDSFSRKDYKIKLSEDFEFHLVKQGGEVVNKSKGESLLLNLSFVSALIQLAETRAKSGGEFLVSGTVAPFVIDAPFGELDDTYRRATASFLPTNSKQLILLLSSSHWNGPVEESIREFVGKEYCLISNKSFPRDGKPLDEIVIRKKRIQQSRYDQARESTEIMEIQ